ncbi:uncharacterized protein YALI1_A16863g [Yarrowia lipolytica]|uniref:Uncharacterized protein n=1 Tax=Yarrowia lipolytica TaxID=4952 RepID=A0A1D8N547_YARLL|nr:hypothetical protein YALI1_A16863g [Yarrowia lipolytica]
MLSGSRFPNPCFLWRCRSSPSTSPACPTSSRTHYNRIRPCLGSSTSTHSQCTLTIFFRTVRVQLVHATSAAAYIIPWAPVCFSYTFCAFAIYETYDLPAVDTSNYWSEHGSDEASAPTFLLDGSSSIVVSLTSTARTRPCLGGMGKCQEISHKPRLVSPASCTTGN